MSIKDALQADMKTAMREKDAPRLSTIRLMLAAMKQREVDERIVLTDEQSIAILNKMIKQRRDAITQFQAGNRPDLVEKEEAEVALIQHYLPQQLSADDIATAVTAAISQTGAASARDMGKVMGVLKALQGKADMTLVSAEVKRQLPPA